MRSISGKALLGRIDEVPGILYVATDFLIVPLVPRGTYVVSDGTEGARMFLGERIPLSLKSVLIAYFRAITWMIAMPCAFVASYLALAGIADQFKLLEKHDLRILTASLFVSALVTVLHWKAMAARWQLAVPTMALVSLAHLARGFFWKNMQQGAPIDPGMAVMPEICMLLGVVASFCVALCSLTGLFVPASFERALELADALGIPRETVEERFRMT